MAPCRFLRLEVPDAARLGVLDACFFSGGFPAAVLLTRCFDLVETSALSGFAAKRDLLRDLGGELVFEGASGAVGPFACPVRLAAAGDEAEAFVRPASLSSRRGLH
ncbi:hypothetical protein [Streptomyces goshikiensis]|uniref:hypothetical protein n=1 Tax=Streptomyces goshikiensis TaxID=1942 RepID=UPI0036A9E790